MRTRKFLYLGSLFAVAMALFVGVWIGLFLIFQHFGFNSQVTPQYGFSSGVGPMLLTAMLGSTILTGMWHGLNCHEASCWRIGKHKVSGTPWCTHHQHLARPQRTAEELLDAISGQLDKLITLLSAER